MSLVGRTETGMDGEHACVELGAELLAGKASRAHMLVATDGEWIRVTLRELAHCLTQITAVAMTGERVDHVRMECAARLHALALELRLAHHTPPRPEARTPDVWDGHSGAQIHLTVRQREVLTYRWQGMPPKQIARVMHLSETTVRAHIRDAIESLGVQGCEAAMHKAHALGLLGDRTAKESK